MSLSKHGGLAALVLQQAQDDPFLNRLSLIFEFLRTIISMLFQLSG